MGKWDLSQLIESGDTYDVKRKSSYTQNINQFIVTVKWNSNAATQKFPLCSYCAIK